MMQIAVKGKNGDSEVLEKNKYILSSIFKIHKQSSPNDLADFALAINQEAPD